ALGRSDGAERQRVAGAVLVAIEQVDRHVQPPDLLTLFDEPARAKRDGRTAVVAQLPVKTARFDVVGTPSITERIERLDNRVDRLAHATRKRMAEVSIDLALGLVEPRAQFIGRNRVGPGGSNLDRLDGVRR